MSHGRPYKCVGTITRVLSVRTRSTESGSMLNVCGSTSAKTTVSPAARASSGTTQNVSDGKTISEPEGRSSAFSM